MSAFSRATLPLSFLAIILGTLLGGFVTTSAQNTQPNVHVATVDGAITPVIARYLDRAIEQAESDNATALIIEMDTPGGTGDAMDDIVEDILASEVPIVVYVTPTGARAASAGVFITYAAHIAAMAPGTNIGSATPVMIGSTGSIGSDEAMERKILNDAIAQITNLAQLRGRNVDWAVSAVRDAANITADEALALGVINMIAPDLESLLQMIDGQVVETAAGSKTISTVNASIDRTQMSVLEEILQFLANPTIAYLLVTFGLIALFVELASPGIAIPGILGAISLVLGLIGLGSLPVVWLGLGLMLLAFVLFVVDIFVPSLGLLTIGGLVCFLIGSNILIADSAPDELSISRPVIWTVTACIGATACLLGSLVIRSQLRQPKTGRVAMIGQVGTARTDLEPSGSVLVFGEIWAAETLGHPIAAGSSVTIERIEGMKAIVRPAVETDGISSNDIGDRHAVIPVR